MVKLKKIFKTLLVIVTGFLLTACDKIENQEHDQGHDFVAKYGGDKLTIVAGSEQKILEPIIEDYAKDKKCTIAIDYLGSLDIMSQLQTGDIEYDAVWPASSIWLNLGDEKSLLKYDEVTAITPVVFGIKESLARELGFLDKDVYVKDIIEAVDSGKLKFAMTSATQSNSGSTAYLGFLSALADGQLTDEKLADPKLQEQIKKLLSGVERSSGSSNWLVDLFMQGNYDAMVNYEQLIIQTNIKLTEEKREPLAIISPVDGLGISDAPLAYVDKGDSKKEELFLDFQEYLLSDSAQDRIEKTGKRNAYGKISQENEQYYTKWGIDVNKILSPAPLPAKKVILEALNLYQTEFKKPSLTIYVLDYSGSMEGEGHEQMIEALGQVLIPENAEKHFLKGGSNDLTYTISFGSRVNSPSLANGNGEELVDLYNELTNYESQGGTNLFHAVEEALELAASVKEDCNPAIVVLTDGMASDSSYYKNVERTYKRLKKDIPVFGILFAEAKTKDLEKLAELTRGRVFDGRSDLIGAFKAVRGYN